MKRLFFILIAILLTSIASVFSQIPSDLIGHWKIQKIQKNTGKKSIEALSLNQEELPRVPEDLEFEKETGNVYLTVNGERYQVEESIFSTDNIEIIVMAGEVYSYAWEKPSSDVLLLRRTYPELVGDQLIYQEYEIIYRLIK